MIMKWGGAFIVFVLAIGATSGGMKGIREAAANRAPKDLTCQAFLAQPPAGEWVHLTGAAGALRDSAFRTKNSVVDRIYVPLACDGSPSSSIRMVLSTEDPSLIRAIAAKQDADIKRDITGMVRKAKDHETGTTIGGGLEGGCANCTVKLQRLAPDYVVVEDGVSPSFLLGLAWLIGAIAGWFALWKIVRS